jgi:hypothetical protein
MISSRAIHGNGAGRPWRHACTPRPSSTSPIVSAAMPRRAQARSRPGTRRAAIVTSSAPEPISPSGSIP